MFSTTNMIGHDIITSMKIYFLKKNPKSLFYYFIIHLTHVKIKYSIKVNNKIKQLLSWP